MRGLFGDFATMPLKDLVVYLGSKNASGVLSLQRDVVRKQVILVNGEAINASSNEPREYLGQFLINLGKITEDQFNRAYVTQRETKVFLGQILVMIGAVSEDQVRNALSLKMRETLLEAYQWTTGTFAFEAEKKPDIPQGLELKIPLSEIHKEGEFRETVWDAIRSVFPRGSCTLKLHRARLAEEPAAGSLDEKLCALIEGGHTIDELVLALHATDFFLYQRLYALHRLEAVTVENLDGALDIEMASMFETPAIVEGASLAQTMEQARTALAAGEYREALAAARQANELGPSSETQALIQQTEATWLATLRAEFMVGKRVPLLKLPPSKLKAMPLTAPERYLLSRFDGKRDLPTIVNVSPLRELEALAHFQRFLEQGLVELVG
ncbi:MAG: hypothetical protein H6Q89_1266 [Myxococcaceae bacterium]|nr:hypothetical protein [Myxococcaceae bacterium]